MSLRRLAYLAVALQMAVLLAGPIWLASSPAALRAFAAAPQTPLAILALVVCLGPPALAILSRRRGGRAPETEAPEAEPGRMSPAGRLVAILGLLGAGLGLLLGGFLLRLASSPAALDSFVGWMAGAPRLAAWISVGVPFAVGIGIALLLTLSPRPKTGERRPQSLSELQRLRRSRPGRGPGA